MYLNWNNDDYEEGFIYRIARSYYLMNEYDKALQYLNLL